MSFFIKYPVRYKYSELSLKSKSWYGKKTRTAVTYVEHNGQTLKFLNVTFLGVFDVYGRELSLNMCPLTLFLFSYGGISEWQNFRRSSRCMFLWVMSKYYGYSMQYGTNFIPILFLFLPSRNPCLWDNEFFYRIDWTSVLMVWSLWG